MKDNASSTLSSLSLAEVGPNRSSSSPSKPHPATPIDVDSKFKHRYDSNGNRLEYYSTPNRGAFSHSYPEPPNGWKQQLGFDSAWTDEGADEVEHAEIDHDDSQTFYNLSTSKSPDSFTEAHARAMGMLKATHISQV